MNMSVVVPCPAVGYSQLSSFSPWPSCIHELSQFRFGINSPATINHHLCQYVMFCNLFLCNVLQMCNNTGPAHPSMRGDCQIRQCTSKRVCVFGNLPARLGHIPAFVMSSNFNCLPSSSEPSCRPERRLDGAVDNCIFGLHNTERSPIEASPGSIVVYVFPLSKCIAYFTTARHI